MICPDCGNPLTLSPKRMFLECLQCKFSVLLEYWLTEGEFGRILRLLQDHKISCGKAAESLSELLHGLKPELPE